jgi:hypothetical protein
MVFPDPAEHLIRGVFSGPGKECVSLSAPPGIGIQRFPSHASLSRVKRALSRLITAMGSPNIYELSK